MLGLLIAKLKDDCVIIIVLKFNLQHSEVLHVPVDQITEMAEQE